ncbi:glycosyltransferase family 2 protein [Methylobacterium terricola]|uniref:Glycosyltransferase family 2 protein n=1 Tax=Methylobacterium terricola TaxID=2583531 RepID=A0A5C4LIQ9_9HYPH|nr:glycosyltransferase family 2 protein [Methylobacterium terricola]TNC12784.1 glycosyltransferase family 2 protein [Methylobacterium terricola]
MPSVDVIIPCYRYADFLAESVGSVLATEECDVRVLILDDASPDHTPDVAEALRRADSRVEYVRHATNHGHIATYNEGLAWARAECLLLLSADDFVTPGALSRAAHLLHERQDLTMAYGPFLSVEEGRPRPAMPSADRDAAHVVYDTRQFFALNRVINPIHTSTAVVRTAVQHRVGGYRPELTHSGDQEMWLRLALRGPVARIDRPQGVWRQHGSNMSSYYYEEMLRDIDQRRRMFDSVFDDPEAACIADMKAEMRLGLAMSAVRHASQPFDRGDVAGARAMMAQAAGISPAVRRTRVWWLQRAKMAMGPRAWQAMRPVITRRLGLSLGRFVTPIERPDAV